jgi:hypothetical protein
MNDKLKYDFYTGYAMRITACKVGGEVPEWPKGADCKSAGAAFGGSNPPLSTMWFYE